MTDGNSCTAKSTKPNSIRASWPAPLGYLPSATSGGKGRMFLEMGSSSWGGRRGRGDIHHHVRTGLGTQWCRLPRRLAYGAGPWTKPISWDPGQSPRQRTSKTCRLTDAVCCERVCVCWTAESPWLGARLAVGPSSCLVRDGISQRRVCVAWHVVVFGLATFHTSCMRACPGLTMRPGADSPDTSTGTAREEKTTSTSPAAVPSRPGISPTAFI
ncbi:hypothetical protein LZ30DRAFT_209546 [Colletotrichum cereale]|nr:hypothetical protein LZ30DRAFT_209546 [Colletotrichum cereale]